MTQRKQDSEDKKVGSGKNAPIIAKKDNMTKTVIIISAVIILGIALAIVFG